MMTRRTVLAGAAALPMAAQASPAFYVPAEETRHERTFMMWPVSRRVHPDPIFLRMVQNTIADIANTIADFEPVVMLAAKADHAKARRKLSEAVELWDIPTEDLWARDAGPLFATNGRQLRVHSMNFNGWGNKQVHKRDGQIAARVAEILDLPFIDTGVTGEPGGVESDGHGTLMAHESSWVNSNRNSASKATIERRLLDAYGANKIIWAPGIWGEDITDYHIDSLARFTAPGKALIQLQNDPDLSDPWQATPYKTYKILANALGKDNITVVPDPQFTRIPSDDFVASYANYYVCNGALITAQFGDPEADQIAQATLAQLYPNRDVIALNVDPLGEMGGGIHCATQQQPAL